MGMYEGFFVPLQSAVSQLKGDGDFLPKDCPTTTEGECNRCGIEECENHPMSEADATCFAVAENEAQCCALNGGDE